MREKTGRIGNMAEHQDNGRGKKGENSGAGGGNCAEGEGGVCQRRSAQTQERTSADEGDEGETTKTGMRRRGQRWEEDEEGDAPRGGDNGRKLKKKRETTRP